MTRQGATRHCAMSRRAVIGVMPPSRPTLPPSPTFVATSPHSSLPKFPNVPILSVIAAHLAGDLVPEEG